MSNLKLFKFYKVAAFMAIVVLFGSSCKDKDDEPVLSGYVGTWVAIESIETEAGAIPFKDIMTFTETSFEDLGQIQISFNKWTDFLSMKGSLLVNGNKMTVTIQEIGMSSFSPVTGLPTGTITSYPAGSDEFNELLDEAGQSQTFESEFSVSGNNMTIKTDNNDDGDYLDEMETSEYTRQ